MPLKMPWEALMASRLFHLLPIHGALLALTAVVAALATVQAGVMALALPVALLAMVGLLRAPILTYTLFVFIGPFRTQPVLAAMPVDVTVLLAGAVVLACARVFIAGRAKKPPFGLLAVFAVIGIILAWSLTWASVPPYGVQKVGEFWTFTLIALVAPFFLIETERDFRRMLLIVVGMAFVGVGLTVTGGAPSPEVGRLELGGNTIVATRLFALGGFLLFFAGALGIRGKGVAFAPVAGVALLVTGMGVGSRGPLVAFAAAMLCTVLAAVVRNPRYLAPLGAVILAAIVLLPVISLPETSQRRLAQAAEEPVSTLKEDGRSVLYEQAIQLIDENTARGIGAGGFADYGFVLSRQGERYPHNVFLELFVEGGILPLLAFAIGVGYALWSVYRRAWTIVSAESRILVQVVAGVLVFSLLAAQFSGDINDNRPLWAFLGICWMLGRNGLVNTQADSRAL